MPALVSLEKAAHSRERLCIPDYKDSVAKYFFLAMRTTCSIAENGMRWRLDMDAGAIFAISIGLLAIWVMMISSIVAVWSVRNRR